MNKNGIRIIFEGKEMAYRTAMDRIEAMGLCTLCVRFLDHDKKWICQKTNLRELHGEIVDLSNNI